jgi:dTDP-4-dehydrorhamnose reductase
MLEAAWLRRDLELISDEYRSFVSVGTLAEICGVLIDSNKELSGLYHIGASEKHSYFSFALALTGALGVTNQYFRPISGEYYSKTQAQDVGERGKDLTLQAHLFERVYSYRIDSLENTLGKLRAALSSGGN